ncbi:MAG: N-acetyltransferase [Acidobacteria bacterium]|nr:MAG: N-acetyltransferase [Acidobacteriota bacterium]
MNVRPVESKADMERFIRFPMKLHRDNPNFVPHLLMERRDFFNPKKNPFFEHAKVTYFLCEEDRKIVGRVAAIVNHAHNEFHGDKVGFFGFFDCEDNRGAAHSLLSTAADWLKKQGMDAMRGPANFSTNDECGLLVEGTDQPPVFMMTWNPAYYEGLVESFGLKKVMDLYAYYADMTDLPMEKLTKQADIILKKAGVTVRKASLKHLEREIADAFQIYNKAWEKNWGFIPMTEAEFTHAAKDMKMILDEDYLFFAEKDGKAVGFSLTLPDLNRILIKMNGRLFPTGIFKLLFGKKHIDTVRVITMGLLPEYRRQGIDLLLYFRTIEEAFRKGVKGGEMSWILENNLVMNHIAEKVGGRRYKTYRFYEKPL